MNRLPNKSQQTLILVAALLCLTQAARAQDPVKIDPKHYTIIKETDTVRILEFKDAPGDKVLKHSHPHYFVYVLSDATRLFTDNCDTHKQKTVVLKQGDYFDKAQVTHCEENTGTTNTHLLVVEFKNRPTKVSRSRRARRNH